MDASRTLARQAGRLARRPGRPGDAGSLAALAAQLGVSDRHLRRIFQAEHGVTPVQYLQTRRLLMAKQLLTDTRCRSRRSRSRAASAACAASTRRSREATA
jgi:AraC family transcriptional regulator of adaptative response / DNA-3-methyladenine glycosylase II